MAKVKSKKKAAAGKPTKTKREGSANATDMTQGLWGDLHTTVLTHMKTISLRSLAAEQRARGFEVQMRKPSKKGVHQKAKPVLAPQGVPNSVFALGQVWPVRT